MTNRKAQAALLLAAALLPAYASAQITINEGSSRNSHTVADATGDHPDWIELHNAGSTPVDLTGHTLSDDLAVPGMWTLPSITIPANGHLLLFCSGNDRTGTTGMTNVVQATNIAPVAGWNAHAFDVPFTWDGSSNILIQLCGLRGNGPGMLNAVCRMTNTSYASCSGAMTHNQDQVCAMEYGDLLFMRPVMRLNGITIGTNDRLNTIVQLPAPYPNWQGGAKQAYLIRAQEMIDAGLTAGPITSIAFDVFDPHGASLAQFDIHFAHTTADVIPAAFAPVQAVNELHTNFKLGRNGETVYLHGPTSVLLDSLHVLQGLPDHSNGRSQDGGADDVLFEIPTPGATNNTASSYETYALAPVIGLPASMSPTPVTVSVTDPNPAPSQLRYTLDGSTPTTTSPLYAGPLTINTTSVLKVRAFKPGLAASPTASASYLIGVDHTTAVISLATPPDGLFGPEGIFTNWQLDDEVQTHVDYFRSNGTKLFSQRSGMQVDGGLGGSRGFPQHSFRLEFDNSALGDGRVNIPLIPDRPARARYSRIYLRNGSNQYQVYPHKDAAQVKMMAGATNNYYAAWTPVTVYVNGDYFGLYELREKYDDEYFKTLEDADADLVDLLTVSAWSGSALRPTEGDVEPFWQDIAAFDLIDPQQPNFWELADARFDLTWYTDYVIGQHWMGTRDWPANNIKIQRSDATSFRWRFCAQDLELAMAPNGQSDHNFDALTYTEGQPQDIPYTRIWQRGITNPRFHDHYINRFADVMNSAFLDDRIQGIAQAAYDLARPEMGRQFHRWGATDTISALATYEANHAAFLADLAQRTPVMRDHLQAFFGLPRQLDVTLDVEPAGTGTIRISTLHPDTYPWEGVYFDGVPVRIEAVAEPGYYFSHWTANGLADVLIPVFLDTLEADAALFEAHFLPDINTAIRDEAGLSFTVYPNPTSTMLHISTDAPLPAGTTYQVVDPSGRLVHGGTVQRTNNGGLIDVSALANGPYHLRSSVPDGAFRSRPFVKL